MLYSSLANNINERKNQRKVVMNFIILCANTKYTNVSVLT